MSLTNQDRATIAEESALDRQGICALSQLQAALLRANFCLRDLEPFLTSLLLCFFADGCCLFGERGAFARFIESAREDGGDAKERLGALFTALSAPQNKRSTSLDQALGSFDFVEAEILTELFSRSCPIPAFDGPMRARLLACAQLDWSAISPTIFGAMYQGALEGRIPNASQKASQQDSPQSSQQSSRRELGAHYTSERNILRALDPLFMDDLRAELAKSKNNKGRLQQLYDRLPAIECLDPACGCGNFLIIAYRELRRLENEVIAKVFDFDQKRGGVLDVSSLCRVRVSQLHGIEIDPAAAHIARVALLITDHQMNLESAERFGTTRPTIPLVDTPHILCANALRVDWKKALAPEQCSYIMSNPPFVGKTFQSPDQKEDMSKVMAGVASTTKGTLDYVAAWFVKALAYIKARPQDLPPIEAGFVATNSITQGEQVAALWPHLLDGGVKIRFAHRTFKWSNEGKGNAAVHCVIIGFGLRQPSSCTIFDYSDNLQAPQGIRMEARRINAYLVDAPDLIFPSRQTPICGNAPPMSFGSMPNDGGNLLLSKQDRQLLLATQPEAKPWIRRFLGADEFINGVDRWCLWLQGITAAQLCAMPAVYKRVQAVKSRRLASSRKTTQELSQAPHLFGEIRQPLSPYLLVPRVSSEARDYVPIGFIHMSVIASDACQTLPDAQLHHFAILSSSMHNAWMRAVCGRLESRYRYSASIVYNNFPWPAPSPTKHKKIEQTAQAILDARGEDGRSTLADLYDPVAMPPQLRKAHAANDKAVDAAYGYKGAQTDAARVAFLFDLYGKLTGLLPP